MSMSTSAHHPGAASISLRGNNNNPFAQNGGRLFLGDVPTGFVRIEVTDTGAGISPENQKKLFGQYMQFNAASLQKGGGTGLGLWISKSIVEMHCGKIGAYSEGEGKGTTFFVELPLFHVSKGNSRLNSHDLQSHSRVHRFRQFAGAFRRPSAQKNRPRPSLVESHFPGASRSVNLQKVVATAQWLVRKVSTVAHIGHYSGGASSVTPGGGGGGGSEQFRNERGPFSPSAGFRFPHLRGDESPASGLSVGDRSANNSIHPMEQYQRPNSNGGQRGSVPSKKAMLGVERASGGIASPLPCHSQAGSPIASIMSPTNVVFQVPDPHNNNNRSGSPSAHHGAAAAAAAGNHRHQLGLRSLSFKNNTQPAPEIDTEQMLKRDGIAAAAASAYQAYHEKKDQLIRPALDVLPLAELSKRNFLRDTALGLTGAGGGGTTSQNLVDAAALLANQHGDGNSDVSDITMSPRSARAGHLLRILLVDDSSMNRKMMRRMLEARGHSILEAGDGLECLNIIRGGAAVDVILMDNHMPNMDGTEATQTMRSDGYSGVIIGVTGDVADEDVQSFMSSGATAVLAKPLDVKLLEDKLRALVVPPSSAY